MKNVANYLQWTSANEGYLVAETVRTERQRIIELPPAIDPNERIIRAEKVKTIAKQRLKLSEFPQEGIRDGVRPVFARGEGQA